MANRFRRVTKAEALKVGLSPTAKRYTAAAPGKFRKTSKTISERQYVKLSTGMTKEQRTKALEAKTISYKPAYSKEKRKRRKRTRRLIPEIKIRHVEIIEKFRASGGGGKGIEGGPGWHSLNSREQEDFQDMFGLYDRDDLLEAISGDKEE